MNINRKKDKPRQEWNPHWLLKVAYGIWSACFAGVKIAIGAAVTVLLIGIVCGLVFVGVLGDYLQGDVLPEANFDLDNYYLDQTSFVYYLDNSGDIKVLQQVNTAVDRQWAHLEEIPEDLVHAAVAIEDKRFYEHQGVDWITTIKACANLFFGGDSKFGGSTITQQLIKNLTQEDSQTVQRKVAEIFRAQLFEKNYNKDTIMEWYLNTIYLGKGCYGVKSAAAKYFGKELQKLTAAECASLISITNNPSIYNPYASTFTWKGEETTGAERNRMRQMNVLSEMLDQGWLTQEEYDAAVEQEMVFKSGIDLPDKIVKCSNDNCGYTDTVSTLISENDRYYCPNCGSEIGVDQSESGTVYSWFVDTVLEDVTRDLAALSGVDYDSLDSDGKQLWVQKVQLGGYHIYSTMDKDAQDAVDVIYEDLTKIPTTRSNQQLQSAIVLIDNSTGDIVAIAGGVGEKVTHDAYNRATDAKLQTGSSQKPISVYAPAFEIGAISPLTVVSDMPISYSGATGAFPNNDSRTYSYSRTIYSGIVSSVNAIAVNTLDKIGFDYAYSFAKEKFGLSNLTDNYVTSSGDVKSDLGYSPLGMGALTVGATVRDMSAAYATFANDGVWREARTYTKVYDSNGNLVLDNTQQSNQILSAKTINYMNYCLTSAVSGGTGSAAQISGQIVAGKTGTTSSSKDRWFCGYTSYYTAAVWCGYDQPEVIRLTGNTSNPACRLWKMVMEPLHQGLTKTPLYDSSGFRSYAVCLDSGMLATDACKADTRVYEYSMNRTASAYAYAEDAPNATCDKHVLVDYCSSGNAVANEYCKKFADAGLTEILSRSLVKMNENEVEQIKAAGNVGLNSAYLDGSYVYYTDGDWHGFSGNANKGVNYPYLVCTEHTKESWEAYKKSEDEKKQQEEEQKKQEESENAGNGAQQPTGTDS